MTDLDRRSFLKRGGAITAGGLTLGGPMQALVARSALAAGSHGVAPHNSGYGPLRPTRDIVTHEVLLDLPEGFLYRSFGRTGELMSDGVPTPGSHDGMAAFEYGDRRFVRLVRNHERRGGGAFGDQSRAYDPKAGGGTTTIELGPHPASPPLASWVSLNGTNVNCAGGLTPWGSWITCEENVNGPDLPGAGNQTYDRKHGYVFEVPSARNSGGYTKGTPILAAGRFQHEAVAFDPSTGIMYQTEDPFGDGIGGFYRYIPPVRGRLDDGGALEMLSVSPAASTTSADLRTGQERGVTYQVRWVPIPDPDPAFTGIDTVDVKAVFNQGAAQGGTKFNRLEGAWYSDGRVFFTSTQGGDARRGQVWVFDIRAQTLTLVFESPGEATLDLPDNITVSPRGSLVLCEDGGGVNYIRGLTLDGRIFDFARNAVPGFETNEFAGACFAQRGHTHGAIRAGASGFMLKDARPEDSLAAVRVVAAGEALLAPSVTRRLIEEFAARPEAAPPPAPELAALTDREREVLALVGRGLANAEIAERLYVSPATAKTHVSHIMTKLYARDRAQLVVLAYESGLVRPGM